MFFIKYIKRYKISSKRQDKALKTCYIFSAAEGLPKIFSKNEDDIVIAADAGYRHLENLKIIPDIVLGDFDSLKFIPSDAEIIKHPVKKQKQEHLLKNRKKTRNRKQKSRN